MWKNYTNDIMDSISESNRRSVSWYKYTCLIAVILEVEEGMSPVDIVPERVMRRFCQLVIPTFPDGKWRLPKASVSIHIKWSPNDGWQPLAHLTNDRAWQFKQKHTTLENVGKKNFRSAQKHTRLKALGVTISVPEESLIGWRCHSDRRDFQNRILKVMEEDSDKDCRMVASHLPPAH